MKLFLIFFLVLALLIWAATSPIKREDDSTQGDSTQGDSTQGDSTLDETGGKVDRRKLRKRGKNGRYMKEK